MWHLTWMIERSRGGKRFKEGILHLINRRDR